MITQDRGEGGKALECGYTIPNCQMVYCACLATNTIAQLEARVQALEADNDRLQHGIVGANYEIVSRDVRPALVALADENDVLKAQVQELQRENATWQKNLADAQADNAANCERIEELQREVARLKGYVQHKDRCRKYIARGIDRNGTCTCGLET